MLVCVKTYDNEAVAPTLAPLLASDTAVVVLKNGIDAEGPLVAAIGPERVVPCVGYVSVEFLAPGRVRHVAAGTLVVGGPAEAAPSVEPARVGLAISGLPVHVAPDIRRARWYKLLWNASFNAISCLTGATSLQLLESAPTLELVQTTMAEVVSLAQVEGVGLERHDIDEFIAQTRLLPNIRPSMLMDREAGRRLEIDALCGAVGRHGRAAGVPTPVSDALVAWLSAVDTIGRAAANSCGTERASAGSPASRGGGTSA